MADFFKNSRGKLIALKSSVDENGDTIFEADDSIKVIDCTEWAERLFEEMANSGSFVNLAYQSVAERYAAKFKSCVMQDATAEVRTSILEYMNQLREESVTAGDENDCYYREEAFTDEDIEL